ncbi:MAG: 50S ribosomal protein L33, partial [Lachnospiraceae bacterium]
MRTKITLACTECKQRNYNTTKDKKTHPDHM